MKRFHLNFRFETWLMLLVIAVMLLVIATSGRGLVAGSDDALTDRMRATAALVDAGAELARQDRDHVRSLELAHRIGRDSGGAAIGEASAKIQQDVTSGKAGRAKDAPRPARDVPPGPTLVGITFSTDGTSATATMSDGTLYNWPVTRTAVTTPPPPPYAVSILPVTLAATRLKFDAATPQVAAFLLPISGSMANSATGGYQMGDLDGASRLALSWRMTGNRDHADKAIQLVQNALMSHPRIPGNRQWIATANGSATSFALPFTDVNTSSLIGYTGTTTDKSVVRGRDLATPDIIDVYQVIVSVGTSSGGSNYVQGVDWMRNTESVTGGESQIVWLPGGHAPAPGSTYHVTEASPGKPVAVTYNATTNSAVFPTAPPAGMSVWVSCTYGARNPDGTGRKWRQTMFGDGGYYNILADNWYCTRWIAKMAMTLDWVSDCPGLEAPLKALANRRMLQWCDQVKLSGYNYGRDTSNYGAGHRAMRDMVALYLAGNGGDAANGNRLISEQSAYWSGTMSTALFGDPSVTYPATAKNGWWAEGVGYEGLTLKGMVLSALAFGEAGVSVPTTALRSWSSSSVASNLFCMPTPTTFSDLGDNYKYPPDAPQSDLWSPLANLADDADAKAWAQYMSNARPASASLEDILLRDPAQAGANDWPAKLGTWKLSAGTGHLSARADWSGTSTWLETVCGNYVAADHQNESMGLIVVKRGPDDLVINPLAPNQIHSPVLGMATQHFRAWFANIVLPEDPLRRHLTTYEDATLGTFAQGLWLGWPGCSTVAESVPNGLYEHMDYTAAWSPVNATGSGGPMAESRRDVVVAWPDRVFVFDRNRDKPSYPQINHELRWHHLPAPNVTPSGAGVTWSIVKGGSSVRMTTFGDQPITATADSWAYPGNAPPVTVNRVRINTTTSGGKAGSACYLTVIDTGTSAAVAGAASQVTTADANWLAAAAGDTLAVFPTSPTPATNPSYTAPGAAIHHRIAGLAPGKPCTITVGGAAQAPATSSPLGSLAFDVPASGAPQAVAVTVGP